MALTDTKPKRLVIVLMVAVVLVGAPFAFIGIGGHLAERDARKFARQVHARLFDTTRDAILSTRSTRGSPRTPNAAASTLCG